jgi:ADP-heptose:LPS heptosyltransferase
MHQRILKAKKIAVVRPNALGDFIFVLPALQALRYRFPEAELVYLGNQWHKDYLVNGRTVVDRVEVVPKVLGTREENYDFIERMKEEQFDIALQMYGGGKWSNPFTKALEAKLSVGLHDEKAWPLEGMVPYIYYQNEYARYLEVVRLVGAEGSDLKPQVKVWPQDQIERIKEPFAVIHPGASDLRRRWPTDRFANVADWLVEEELRVVVTGIKKERELVEAVIGGMRESKKAEAKYLSLEGLTGLLSQARVVVSNDTGPYHLAYALGSPVVGIFWGPNLINGAPWFKAKARTLASWQLTCPTCGYDMATAEIPLSAKHKGCTHAVSFVKKVTVEEVKREVHRLIDLRLMNNDESYR